jgi:ABC-type antimicrobial peptide transport system permease subunit
LRKSFAEFGGGIFWSLLLSGLALLVVGALAGLIPALRAASVDPAKALRAE